VRKVVHVVSVLLIVSFATSVMLNLTPGDPAIAILGDTATKEQIQQVHEQLNLDDPVLQRYVDWVGNIVQGDFGTSFHTKESVTDMILQALPVTLELIVLSLLVALAMAVPAAIYAAYRPGSRFDHGLTAVSSFFVSCPPFISVPILVYLLVLQVHIFPASGWVK